MVQLLFMPVWANVPSDPVLNLSWLQEFPRLVWEFRELSNGSLCLPLRRPRKIVALFQTLQWWLHCIGVLEFRITKLQNGLDWKGLKALLVPTLPWARPPSTRPRCPKPHLIWSWTLPWMLLSSRCYLPALTEGQLSFLERDYFQVCFISRTMSKTKPPNRERKYKKHAPGQGCALAQRWYCARNLEGRNGRILLQQCSTCCIPRGAFTPSLAQAPLSSLPGMSPRRSGGALLPCAPGPAEGAPAAAGALGAAP